MLFVLILLLNLKVLLSSHGYQLSMVLLTPMRFVCEKTWVVIWSQGNESKVWGASLPLGGGAVASPAEGIHYQLLFSLAFSRLPMAMEPGHPD